MSLHAQISSEALAKLDAQKRNSTISSVIIALLVCALLAATLFLIALSPLFKNKETMVTYAPSSHNPEEIIEPEITSDVKKIPASPSQNMANIIHSNIPAPIALPVTTMIITDPLTDMGDNSDFGKGWGDSNSNGNGKDGLFKGITRTSEARCTAKNRISRLLKEGGKEEYEEQVIAALRWLKTTQSENGSWNVQNKPIAMTSLALLAYLGHCETPLSTEFGHTVEKAIYHLITNSKKNGGPLATTTTDKHWCYEHPIATYALAEAYTLCTEFNIIIPDLKETVLAAGNHIIGSQNKDGGWAYNYQISAGHTDSSIVCWQLQALKACKTTKLEFPNLQNSAKRGIKFLESCKSAKGVIAYKTGGKNHPGSNMTAGGVLCFQQWGKGKKSLTRNGVKWVTKNINFDYHKQADLYVHYYASQAMINAGGSAWNKYNKKTMANLAKNQNTDGSWPIPTKGGHQMTSKHYATCLATLMMEVYYRFLPSSE